MPFYAIYAAYFWKNFQEHRKNIWTFNVGFVFFFVFTSKISGMFVGYIFDNVTAVAARAKGSIRMFIASSAVVLEYWQFQWCNGNHNRFEVSILNNNWCASLSRIVRKFLSLVSFYSVLGFILFCRVRKLSAFDLLSDSHTSIFM